MHAHMQAYIHVTTHAHTCVKNSNLQIELKKEPRNEFHAILGLICREKVQKCTFLPSSRSFEVIFPKKVPLPQAMYLPSSVRITRIDK